ncbi:phospho-sugar mutase [Carbonactinospora thermoautotrophica]|uniref:phospho-sugar mutase n=1 Tax=Carbonactinospora thermoautotrophica TaxID=1469144 RepID=UPI000BB4EDC2|nr:phospho-sugar mutase [Carbonactinospora thermoautotrophica]
MTVGGADLLDEARAWLAEDPDPETRAELAALIENNDVDALADRFSGPLEFGTAGLRGALGPGPNRMNRVVVTRAAAGLAAYLKARDGKAVVIGYDARRKSDVFAADSAAVFAGAGLRALVLPHPVPTPVLAFAIRHLGVDAGVMVTASHNPPQDNGYKVYLGDGCQIVPPADVEISAEIAAVGPLATVPRGSEWDTLGDDVLEAYLDRAASVVSPSSPRDISVVYTPLHGVGMDVLVAAFRRAGFPAPYVVAEQAQPDPDFPTVSFPNPEEPGAIDLAVAAASETDADLVIANDPDADRCAVAVPTPEGWRMLRGDEVGWLLGYHLIRRGVAEGTFATTIVSSSLLSKMARDHGLGYAETLTGFKWLSRVKGLRYAYEEALGYCVDPAGVCDKDGITAALLVAELAATLKAEDRDLGDLLDEIEDRYGVHATGQLSPRFTDLARIDAALELLRAEPPAELGGRKVITIEDLADGVGDLPPTDGVRLWLEDGARVIVRPSGTEPKLKCYLEIALPPGGGSPRLLREHADNSLAMLKRDLGAVLGLP